MPGRIKSEDVVLVKERASLEDVVAEHVTLRRAGIGSLKGLCPFHDEKTPSFTVRPAMGTWHCFGCGEGGDVLTFIEKIDHLNFAEAVERLAGKVGVELHYEEGGGPARDGEGIGKRTRLIEAHRVAQEFYHQALLSGPDARAGRDFLRARGFDSAAASLFGVGYAPRGGEELTRQLREKGFTEAEMVTAGLSGQGRRGLYDRFRGRLVWPIRDITGDPVGFGARRLFDDDRIEAKYLNTAETPIYRKTSLLYGLDLAKKAIVRDRQVVIVEGYTDVMAAHLAGVEGAVATCGTAFGVDHIKTLRRLLRDEASNSPSRTIFTFDGDAAGQKAAMRAFEEDQRWASQSFVAVAPNGQDPCEVRLASGDQAVRDLIADAVPMFEFAVRTTLARYDMETVEGRVRSVQAVAPILAGIRDKSLQPEYVRSVAGWVGVPVETVAHEVSQAAGRPPAGATRPISSGARPGGHDRAESATRGGGRAPLDAPFRAQRAAGAAGLRDPVLALERQLLQVLLQFPSQVRPEELAHITGQGFMAPAHRAVFDAILAAGTTPGARSSAAWVGAVRDASAEVVEGLVTELATAPLPARPDPVTGAPDQRYVDSLVLRAQEMSLTRQIADATSSLQRLEADDTADPAAVRQAGEHLTALHRQLAAVRERLT